MAKITADVSEKETIKRRWQVGLLVGGGVIFVGLAVVFVRGEVVKAEERARIEAEVKIVTGKAEAVLSQVQKGEISRGSGQEMMVELQVAMSDLVGRAKKLAKPDLNEVLEGRDKALARGVIWIYGKETVREKTPIYDVRMIDKNWQIDKAELINGEMWLVDLTARKIARVNLENKKFRVEDLAGQTRFAARYSGDDGGLNQLDFGQIYRYEVGATGSAPPKIEILTGEKAEVGVRTDFFVANNSYYYFWSSQDGEIWRLKKASLGREKEVTNRNELTAWLKPRENLTLAEVSDVAATNELWAGTKDGEIRRLQGGGRLDWPITNLAEKIEGEIKISVGQDGELVFVLARDQGRAIVIDKESGEAIRDLRLELLERQWVDIVEDIANGKFYLISTTEIFEIGL